MSREREFEIAMGRKQQSSSSKDNAEKKPVPIDALEKQQTQSEFAYVADQQRAAISNNP